MAHLEPNWGLSMCKFLAWCAVTAFATFVSAAAAHDHKVQRGRLIFADHEKPVVSILDLDTFQVTHRFDVSKQNPTLATIADGRYVVIKTGDDAGTVRFLDTGLIRESHGDHDDIEKSEPKLLEIALTGDRPAHVISQNGWVAVFFDGPRPWEKKVDAKAALIRLNTLADKKPHVADWTGSGAQHGIAVPLGRDQWLISVAKPAYVKGDDKSVSSRPDGFQVLQFTKAGWKPGASFNDLSSTQRSCKEFHGHAWLKNVHVFGCHQRIDGSERSDGGMLVVEREKSGAWTSRKIAYPDDRRASTIKSAEGGRYMVANYGLKAPYDALLRVDPKAKTIAEADAFAVPDGQPACQYEVAPGGKRVVNLTPDGKLRLYDIAPQWKQAAAFDAVPAFDCQYGATTPTPTLAIIGDSAFISDPINRRIREYYLNTMKQGPDAPIDGMPANIAGGGHGG
jgi:hypothetical protein